VDAWNPLEGWDALNVACLGIPLPDIVFLACNPFPQHFPTSIEHLIAHTLANEPNIPYNRLII
jgi:hypothetical protein